MQDLTIFINNHPMLSLATAIVFVLLVIVELLRNKRQGFQLTPVQTTQMINHDHAVIVDIRPNEVYRKGHILDAQSWTVKDLKENTKKLEKLKNKPIILVCHVGGESQKVAALLIKQGYNAYSLAGGMRAWNEAQMPLIKE